MSSRQRPFGGSARSHCSTAALLSLLGLAQFFSSPANTVYWTYPSRGQVFGPFINHNHFAEYVNLCIGLGIGLLVGRGLRNSWDRPRHRVASLVPLLHDPPALWICAALALMVSSVAFSRSRGGMAALVGAAVVCAVLGRLRFGRSFRLGSALLVGALAFGLLSWFGLDLLKERFATIWTGEAYDSRVPLWLRSLPIAADFPVWGTGYGTYGYIEPMYRVHVPKDAGLQYHHAHNEYLEILIEGGVPGLLLAVLAIALVYRQGYRALSLHGTAPDAGLALGALFAFTSVVIHGFCEFGLHIPAIALLATVLCAHLCAQGTVRSSEGDSAPDAGAGDEGEYRFRLGGLAPLGGAVLVVSLGLVLCAGGWKAHRIDRLQYAAFQASHPNEEQLRRRVELLAAAASLSPDDANLSCLLGHARVQLHKMDSVRWLLTGRSGTRQDVLALQAFLRARDACPVCVEAQLGIAALASRLTQGDPQEAYLRRVKLLDPSHPERWYLCGGIELEAGHADAAWASWRRALELSPDYLDKILPAASSRLDSATLLETVLPDDAAVLLAAALWLHPDAEEVDKRRPFLQKALRLLQSRNPPLQTQDFHLTARIYKELDQPKEAVAAYRELLRREPRRVEWRLEFARYLCDIHQLAEARRELVLILNQEPEQGVARNLLHQVTSDLLRKRAENRSGDRSREK